MKWVQRIQFVEQMMTVATFEVEVGFQTVAAEEGDRNNLLTFAEVVHSAMAMSGSSKQVSWLGQLIPAQHLEAGQEAGVQQGQDAESSQGQVAGSSQEFSFCLLYEALYDK